MDDINNITIRLFNFLGPMLRIGGINTTLGDTGNRFSYIKKYLYDAEFNAVELVLAVLGLFFNILLALFILKRKLLCKTSCCKFFLNLQTVHIILCMSSMGFRKEMKDIHVAINNGLLMELFLSMFLTILDRLIAIKFPYLYQRLTTRRVLIIIGSSWIPGIVFTATVIMTKPGQIPVTTMSTILIFVAMLILVSSNIMIWFIVKRHKKTVQRECTPAHAKISAEKRKLKSTYVCMSIVTTFLLLWLPFLVHNVLLLTQGDVDKAFQRGTETVVLVNTVIDPWLFIIFRRDVKDEIRSLRNRYWRYRLPH